MRVIFDVNVLVRIALGSELAARILRQTLDSGGRVLVCDPLLAELAETLSKPRLIPHLRPEVAEQLMVGLTEIGEPVEISEPLPACRDPDDAYLLGAARDGRADYLVTGDQDLLSQESLEACQIITPEAFASVLGERV